MYSFLCARVRSCLNRELALNHCCVSYSEWFAGKKALKVRIWNVILPFHSLGSILESAVRRGWVLGEISCEIAQAGLFELVHRIKRIWAIRPPNNISTRDNNMEQNRDYRLRLNFFSTGPAPTSTTIAERRNKAVKIILTRMVYVVKRIFRKL